MSRPRPVKYVFCFWEPSMKGQRLSAKRVIRGPNKSYIWSTKWAFLAAKALKTWKYQWFSTFFTLTDACNLILAALYYPKIRKLSAGQITFWEPGSPVPPFFAPLNFGLTLEHFVWSWRIKFEVWNCKFSLNLKFKLKLKWTRKWRLKSKV